MTTDVEYETDIKCEILCEVFRVKGWTGAIITDTEYQWTAWVALDVLKNNRAHSSGLVYLRMSSDFRGKTIRKMESQNG